MIEAAAMLTLVMPSSIGNHLKEIGVIAVTFKDEIGSEVRARSPKVQSFDASAEETLSLARLNCGPNGQRP